MTNVEQIIVKLPVFVVVVDAVATSIVHQHFYTLILTEIFELFCCFLLSYQEIDAQYVHSIYSSETLPKHHIFDSIFDLI